MTAAASDLSPLLERLRAVSNDVLNESLRSEGFRIADEKFQTAFQCVAASHDLGADLNFPSPADIPQEMIRSHRLKSSVVFMAFTTLCFMRAEHLERKLDAVPESSPLRPFRDIYRAGSMKAGEDTLVQHVRNSLAHGTFTLGQKPEIVFTDRSWQQTLAVSQLMELCEHVHRFYHEAFHEAVPRPPHWSKYGPEPMTP